MFKDIYLDITYLKPGKRLTVFCPGREARKVCLFLFHLMLISRKRQRYFKKQKHLKLENNHIRKAKGLSQITWFG